MFSRIASRNIVAAMTTVTSRGYKVAVVGAAGGIGQPLSLLMKLNKNVTELSLYDVVNTPGVAAVLNHTHTWPFRREF
jgi:malate dehydrogenase